MNMPPRSALHSQSSRLAAVQTPVIPVVGRWIAETPGTISLGQGVVSYGPPPEAIEAARRFGYALTDHRYGPVEGLPALVEAIEDKLARENGIRVRGSSRVVVTAGGNLAFVNAILAVTDPGDEVILPAPYYFNHEMAIVIAGGRAVPVPTFRDYQLDVQAIADAITPRTRAVVTVSPEQPDRRGVLRRVAPRGERALRRSRPLPHPRRGVRVLHLRRRAATFRPARSTAHPATPSRSIRCRRRTAWRAGASGTW